MSNEWIYGEYKGTVDLLERGERGPWALLDAAKLDDEDNSPLVQVGLSEEQFNSLKEDDEVLFVLTKDSDGVEVGVTYLDADRQPEGITLIGLRKV